MNDSWTQMASLPFSRCAATGFSIGTKGYLGTGIDSSWQVHREFWEYDAANNLWSSKTNFQGTSRRNAVAFSIGTKGYIGTGIDSIWTVNDKDFWEFDPNSTGVFENEESININIFPNPSTDFISVTYKSKTKNPQFEILDVTGRKAAGCTLKEVEQQINISKLPQGLYVLKVIDGENSFANGLGF